MLTIGHRHENRALICMDEPYALVIFAQAGIYTDQSLDSCFRRNDSQSQCKPAKFSSSVVPISIGMFDCELFITGYTHQRLV